MTGGRFPSLSGLHGGLTPPVEWLCPSTVSSVPIAPSAVVLTRVLPLWCRRLSMAPGCVGVPIISVVTIAALDADTNTIEVADADRMLLLHFNDVYNITERETEPVGGVPRFKGLIDSFAEQDPLVLFSGDALSPSNSKGGLSIFLLLVALLSRSWPPRLMAAVRTRVQTHWAPALTPLYCCLHVCRCAWYGVMGGVWCSEHRHQGPTHDHAAEQAWRALQLRWQPRLWYGRVGPACGVCGRSVRC